MKYLLILSLFQGGVVVLPNEYPTKSACDIVGRAWEDSGTISAYYFCTEKL